MTRRTRWSALTLILFAAACGGSVVQQAPLEDDDDTLEGGGGTTPGTGGGVVLPEEQGLSAVNAPTETAVHVEFDRPAGASAQLADSYQLISDAGDLVISAVSVAPDGLSADLVTDKQKLGITYELVYSEDGESHDASFLAADTARFWTYDWSSPNFDQLQIVADRRNVGTHGVIYVEQGEQMGDANQVMAKFDGEVFPIETSNFIEAPDRDGNGRIVLLGLDGQGAYGGYFNPIDTFPDEESFGQWGYHSNEMEVLYLNVESGIVSGGDIVVPHEFSHLLYQELHPSLFEDWPYHNEGLAECAVNLVNGTHDYAAEFYLLDYFGDLANGKSLVDWEYGNYSQYAQAFIFWSYAAGQLGGKQGYVQLIQQNGHPANMQSFLEQQIGKTFGETQLDMLIATWAQQDAGDYSFNGVLTLPTKPTVASSGSLSLGAFTGVFLTPGQSPVTPSGNEGPNILFAGVNAAGQVDLTAPYDVNGGALIAFNSVFDLAAPSPQPIGLFPAAPAAPPTAERSHAWLHPPPFNPTRLDRMRAWRERTRAR